MKVNYNKINSETGLGVFSESELLHYVSRLVDELEAHNKNYTKKQYRQITDLKAIIDNITE
jgi:hypothetical protein